MGRSACFYLLILALGVQAQLNKRCYDEINRPVACEPPFENAAYLRHVDATNTCGDRPGRTEGERQRNNQYCWQTNIFQPDRQCDYCLKDVPGSNHPPRFLTDQHRQSNVTWWQSDTLKYDIQYPNSVNLTIDLGAKYDVTYVRLKFHSSRPDSFVILRRNTETEDWMPWQYYSSSCLKRFNMPSTSSFPVFNQAGCTDKHSDITPLRGATIVFSTLRGRDVDAAGSSPGVDDVVLKWKTARYIRIMLSKLNTFGDDIFGDDMVLKSYYYAIEDLAIGGRCQCFGHGSNCTLFDLNDPGTSRRVCDCKHNTEGDNCERCKPFYNDLPWQRGVICSRSECPEAFQCQQCDCNGYSSTCVFDEQLYQQTGSGGRCTNCQFNTDGPHCERCLPDYYRPPGDQGCKACLCHPQGSRSMQCTIDGQCDCKPGVTGKRCDQCMGGYWGFGQENGCTRCVCDSDGTQRGFGNQLAPCNPITGDCLCKKFTTGPKCDRCMDGYFGLSESNPRGCIKCFCYGHTLTCRSSSLYRNATRVSDFSQGPDGFSLLSFHEPASSRLINGYVKYGDYLSADFDAYSNDNKPLPAYFTANKFISDSAQLSYDRELRFVARLRQEALPNERYQVFYKILLQAQLPDNVTLFNEFRNGGNSLDGSWQTFRFQLNEEGKWRMCKSCSGSERAIEPTAFQFQQVMRALTAIKVVAALPGAGPIDIKDFSVEAAGVRGGAVVNYVPSCDCPDSYTNQFCERCNTGFRRAHYHGNEYDLCLPCNCNGHNKSPCDENTGKCFCENGYAGDHCELCDIGFYGNATNGGLCEPCPASCGLQGCRLMDYGSQGQGVVCLGCREGYTGRLCQECADGYYETGSTCSPCFCNDNIDLNAVGNCHPKTGVCLKCIYNTTGDKCQKCITGYFGNPLAADKCKPCSCDPIGTEQMDISPEGLLGCSTTGQCPCKMFVDGLRCDRCKDGFFNITSGEGCKSCDCDKIGTRLGNTSCDIVTGQCYCSQGIEGLKCERCKPNYYGHGRGECLPCECNGEGSETMQCADNGQCTCKPNVVGLKCDQCAPNYYNLTASCSEKCDQCYDKVQDEFEVLEKQVRGLNDSLYNIDLDKVDDQEAKRAFNQTIERVKKLLNDLVTQFSNVIDRNRQLKQSTPTVEALIRQANEQLKAIEQDLADGRRLIQATKTSAKKLTSAIESMSRLGRQLEQTLSALHDDARSQGNELLDKLRKTARLYGERNENMTRMANESTILAQRQTEDSNELADKGQTATQLTDEAKQSAVGAVEGVAKLAESLSSLSTRLDHHKEICSELQDALDALKNSQDDIESKLENNEVAEGNLNVPSVNTDQLKASLKDLRDQINKLSNNLTEVIKNPDYKTLYSDMESLLGNFRQHESDFATVKRQLDGLSLRLGIAVETANTAKENELKVSKELEELRTTLDKFQETLEEKRRNVDKALARIPEVEKMLDETDESLNSNDQKLTNAPGDARKADSIASKAKEIAAGASKKAAEIAKDSSTTSDRLTALDDDINQLKEKLQQHNGTAVQVAGDIANAKSAAANAASKASEVAKAAEGYHGAIEDSLRTLDRYLEILETPGQFTEEQVSQLEKWYEDLAEDDDYGHVATAVKLNKRLVEHRESYHELKLQFEDFEEEYNRLVDVHDLYQRGEVCSAPDTAKP